VGFTNQHSLSAEDLQECPLQPGQTLVAQRRSRSFNPSLNSTPIALGQWWANFWDKGPQTNFLPNRTPSKF